MIDQISKLKEVIQIAKDNQIKKIKVGTIEIEFSDKIVIERKDLGPLVGKTEGNLLKTSYFFGQRKKK